MKRNGLMLIEWVFVLVIFVIFAAITSAFVNCWKWDKTPAFKWECELISVRHSASTRRAHLVPVVTGRGGVGFGVVTSGDSEKFVTVWDCGRYGRLVADDENIFRWAQNHSVLYLKQRGESVRIVGIEKP